MEHETRDSRFMIKALLVPFAIPPCFFGHIKNKAHLAPFAVPPYFFRHIKNILDLISEENFSSTTPIA